MWQYNYTNELAHYGVPGMKWGHRKAARLEKRATKRFAKAGKYQGKADYYRSKGNDIYKKHDSMAIALDKKAKAYERQGGFLKAEVTRRAAEALRKRGQNARAESDQMAAHYEKKTKRLMDKADKYATKKHVDLGKKRINSILKESAKKGMDQERSNDEWMTERRLEDRMGENNYAAYNKIRGKS